jgi:hypothetical protein
VRSVMIYAMHGVVRAPSHGVLTDLWMFDAASFADFLMQRPPFVGLGSGLAGFGDALTIDDATVAAYDAALLARRYGHDVTLFVNSEYVRNADPFYLHVLSAIIERASSDQLSTLSRKHVGLDRALNKFSARELLKHHLTRLPDEVARKGALQSLVGDLDMVAAPLPAHLRTLSQEQLRELLAEGVQLENHGATHAHFSIFPDSDIRNQITVCRSWLRTTLSVQAQYFAVPFGDVLPRFALSDDIASCWFTVNSALHSGFVGPKIYNRMELKL